MLLLLWPPNLEPSRRFNTGNNNNKFISHYHSTHKKKAINYDYEWLSLIKDGGELPLSLRVLSVVCEAHKRQVLPSEALRHTEGIHRWHPSLIFKLLKVAGVIKAIHNGDKWRCSCKEEHIHCVSLWKVIPFVACIRKKPSDYYFLMVYWSMYFRMYFW